MLQTYHEAVRKMERFTLDVKNFEFDTMPLDLLKTNYEYLLAIGKDIKDILLDLKTAAAKSRYELANSKRAGCISHAAVRQVIAKESVMSAEIDFANRLSKECARIFAMYADEKARHEKQMKKWLKPKLNPGQI